VLTTVVTDLREDKHKSYDELTGGTDTCSTPEPPLMQKNRAITQLQTRPTSESSRTSNQLCWGATIDGRVSGAPGSAQKSSNR